MSNTAARAAENRNTGFSLREFLSEEALGGLILLVCAAIALVWANSPWSGAYHDLSEATISLQFGDFVLSHSVVHWINDGLMAIFFFVVGLEIKHELLVGELSDRKRAMLPIIAAAGGALLPAIIFLVVNRGGPGEAGWGVPMATDIAFSLGVLALFGTRAPVTLKIFLMALAIVDDLIAVLVIAVFYTETINLGMVGLAVVMLAVAIVLNVRGVYQPLWYLAPGLVLWFAVLNSGIHATIAGILLAMTIPATARVDTATFATRARELIQNLDRAAHTIGEGDDQDVFAELESLAEDARSPVQRLISRLHPFVVFVIMPAFALANAGVEITNFGHVLTSPIALGVVLGLVLGKQLGIFGATWVAVRLGIATLPAGIGWRQVYALGWLGGIGFTMSLFITGLAFDPGELQEQARLGVLAASAIGSIGGAIALLLIPGPGEIETPRETADHADSPQLPASARS